VWLTAESLAGSGLVAANGGSGQDSVGGGGGGGRVAIYAPSNDFAGAVTASGGAGFASGQDGSIYVSTNSAAAPAVVAAGPVPLSINQIQSTSLVVLKWSAIAGASYQVQSSTDLRNWHPCGAAIGNDEGETAVLINLVAEPGRFFRLVPAN
jgi:hypothetical protein